MCDQWPVYTVAELQHDGFLRVEDGNHGEYRPRPAEFEETGVSFIRAADMDDGRVRFESASRINDVALQRIRKGIGAPGDVLLSHKGTVGKVAFVPLDAEPFVCSPQTTFWRSLDQSVIDRRYLYYYLCSTGFQGQLASVKGESDMADYVSLSVQRTLKVALPPLPEQRAIAHILGTLDDKIELNRRMNATLEEMARALFKSWFVDFDPVRAKAAGRQPTGMDAATAALFPDSFEDSELGVIPRGWRVSTIGECARVVGGSTPSTRNPAFWNGGIHHWATPKDLASLSSPMLLDTERRITDAGLEQISSGLLPRGTVLLSSRAPIGYLAIASIPIAVNQGFIAMICDGTLPNYYVLYWAQASMDTIIGRANGTTFLEVSKANFRPIDVLVPASSVLRKFAALIDPLMTRMSSNLQESRRLVQIRDSLLPMLLSGETSASLPTKGHEI